MGSFSLWHWLIIIAVIAAIFMGQRRSATAWAGLDADVRTYRHPASDGSGHGMLEGVVMPAILTTLALVALFLSVGNLPPSLVWSIAGTAAIGCVLAAAQAPVVISGAVDLSLGGTMVLSATIMALATLSGVPGPLAVLAALVVGIGCGVANAVLVRWTQLPSFAVTLATGQIATGVAYGVTDGITDGHSYLQLDTHDPQMDVVMLFGGRQAVAAPVLAIAVTIGLGWLVSRSRWGHDLFTTGAGAERAARTGVRVDRVRLTVFVLAGIAAAVAGWMFVGRLSVVMLSMGTDSAMRSLAAVVAGGVLLSGGYGSVIGAALGAVALSIAWVALSVTGVESFWISTFTPVLLLGAAFAARQSRDSSP